MKKILTLILAMAALALTACSSTTKSSVPADPGEAAVYYFNFAKEADFDNFLDGFYFGPEVSAAMVTLGKEMLKQSIKEAGGIDGESLSQLSKLGVKLVDSHSHGADEAHVTLELTNPDGNSEQTTFDMKKIEGVWKIVVPM